MQQGGLNLSGVRIESAPLNLSGVSVEPARPASAIKPRTRRETPAAAPAGWQDSLKGWYRQTYGEELPVSADGQTSFHASRGLDHSDRIDIKLSPKTTRGREVMSYMERAGVPFLPSYGTEPWSTGEHIHGGPNAHRLGAAPGRLEYDYGETGESAPSLNLSGVTVEPSGEDDTVRVESALDRKTGSALPLNDPRRKAGELPTQLPDDTRPAPLEASGIDEAEATHRRFDVRLPEGKTDWSEVSGAEFAQAAARQFAASRGIPADYAEKWIARNAARLRFYDLEDQSRDLTPAERLGTDDYDPARRTLRTNAELPIFNELEDEFKESGDRRSDQAEAWQDERTKAIGERGAVERAADWALDPNRKPGEKFMDVAAPVAETFATGADYAGRGFSAASAAFWSGARAQTPLGVPDPKKLEEGAGALAAALKGEPMPEAGRNPVGEAVRGSEALRSINPRLPTLLGVGADIVTDPSNLIPVGGAAKAAGLLRRTRAGAAVASKLEGAAVRVFGQSGGRVFDFDAAGEALASRLGEVDVAAVAPVAEVASETASLPPGLYQITVRNAETGATRDVLFNGADIILPETGEVWSPPVRPAELEARAQREAGNPLAVVDDDIFDPERAGIDFRSSDEIFGRGPKTGAEAESAPATADAPSTEVPPVPESLETVNRQLQALVEGRRKAVHITPGEPLPDAIEGFATTPTARGFFVHDPRVVSAEEVRARAEAGTLGELMGHVEEKPAEPAGLVVARDPETKLEIQVSYVSGEETAAEQARAFQEQHPGAEVVAGGPELEADVLAARQGGANGSSFSGAGGGQGGAGDADTVHPHRDGRGGDAADATDAGPGPVAGAVAVRGAEPAPAPADGRDGAVSSGNGVRPLKGFGALGEDVEAYNAAAAHHSTRTPEAPTPEVHTTANEWQQFPPDSGTLGVPRASMPQIKSEHRGAMVQFLKGQGITHRQESVRPDSLKPTQAEFSPAKVERARGFEGPQRPVLVSADDHVIDGHHQWLAALEDAPAEPYPAIRLDAPAQQLLIDVARFPSSGVDDASEAAAHYSTRQAAPRVKGEYTPAIVAEGPAAGKPAAADDATDFLNFDRLNVSDEEKGNLARLVSERVSETGYKKGRVSFEDVKREAESLAPELGRHLRNVKDDTVLNPAVRYAAKRRLNDLNAELLKTHRGIEDGRNTLSAEDLEKLEARAAILEFDAKQLVDILIPTRTAAGRALAFERMLADKAGFDLETHIARARKVAERSGADLKGAEWQKNEGAIRAAVATGGDAQRRLDALESQINKLKASPEIQAAVRAYSEAVEQKLTAQQARRAARRATAESFKVKLYAMEQEARGRLKAVLGPNTLNDASVIGAAIADLSIVGASKLVRKGVDGALFAREMIEEFGEDVRQYLPAIFKRSYELYKSERAASIKAARTLRLTGGKPEDFSTEAIEGLLKEADEQRKTLQRARLDLARTYARLQRTSRLDTFTALRKSSLLANVWGASRDIISTGIFQPTDQLARAFGSLADIAQSLVSKNDRQLLGAQPVSLARATVAGYRKAAREIPQVMREGATREQLERLELPHEVNSGSRVVDAAVAVVGRYRTSVDLPAFNQAQDFALRERAKLQAIAEKKAGTVTDVKARAAELYKQPTEALHALAVTDAAQMTFHETLRVSEALRRAKSVGGLTRFSLETVIPFERAVTGVFYRGAQYSGLGVVEAGGRALNALVRRTLSPDEQRAISLAFGRGATGVVGLVPLGYALASRGQMTGALDDELPQRELKRAAGRRPLSFFNPLTGGWTSLEVLGPAMMPLAIGATIHQENSQPGQKGGGDYVKGIAQLSTLAPQMRAVKDLANSATEAGTGAEFGGRYLSTFIPGILSDLAGATDDRVRDTSGFLGPSYNRVPGLRSGLPEKQDALGRPVTGKSAENDPVIGELLRSRIGLSRPKRNEGEGAAAYRARLKAEGENVQVALRSLFETESYSSLSDAKTRGAVASSVMEYAREATRKGLTVEAVKHNSVVRAELTVIGEELKRRGVPDKQRERVMGRARVYLRGAMLEKRDGPTLQEARDALTLGLGDLRADMADLIEEASQIEEDER